MKQLFEEKTTPRNRDEDEIMSYFSLLRIKCDKDKCVSCGKCKKVCPMNVEVTIFEDRIDSLIDFTHMPKSFIVRRPSEHIWKF
jgi:ferredoxin